MDELVILLAAPESRSNAMKVGVGGTHYESAKVWLGSSFIGFAVVTAIVLLPGATKSASPSLYVLILGGLFVGVPGTLGIGMIIEQLHLRKNRRTRIEDSN